MSIEVPQVILIRMGVLMGTSKDCPVLETLEEQVLEEANHKEWAPMLSRTSMEASVAELEVELAEESVEASVVESGEV